MTRRVRSLGELGALREALHRDRRHTSTPDDNRAEAPALAATEAFAAAVGPLTPLPRRHIADTRSPRPPPLPRQRERDERAALASTLCNDVNAESLLETDDALSFRRAGVGADVVRKLRSGVWAIQAEIDLHGLRRESARARLAEFLREAQAKGVRCVRVVHGKGHGSPGKSPILKPQVRRWLAQSAAVIAFTQARALNGGAGAVIVLLRPTRDFELGRTPNRGVFGERKDS